MKPALWLPAVCLLAVLSAQAQDLPEGAGQAAVKKVCSGCHGFEVITQNHNSKDRWEAVVENMASRGAEASDEELEQIVQYLAQNFGPVREKVNVNKASTADMVKNLGLTEKCAAAIVEYRAKTGIKNLDELKSVPGADAKAIDAKKDWIEF